MSHLRADGVPLWGSRGAAEFCGRDEAPAFFNRHVPSFDRVLQDGENFAVGDVQFLMLDTPGHTNACASYFATIDGVRCAFTGDIAMVNECIGYSGSPDFDPDRLMSSLENVLQQDFDALFTGHMLLSNQPEGFWMTGGKSHIRDAFQAGLEGRWDSARQPRRK